MKLGHRVPIPNFILFSPLQVTIFLTMYFSIEIHGFQYVLMFLEVRMSLNWVRGIFALYHGLSGLTFRKNADILNLIR